MGPDSWNHRPALRRQMIELSGLTMGIIGFGGTGRAVARRAHAFGMHCQAIDRDAVANSPEVSEVQRPAFFPELLATSDVVAICCPLTSETKGLFNDAAFAYMKPSALLVNVTRGEVIVEDALVRAIQGKQIRGAALDVAMPQAAAERLLAAVSFLPGRIGLGAERSFVYVEGKMAVFNRDPLEDLAKMEVPDV